MGAGEPAKGHSPRHQKGAQNMNYNRIKKALRASTLALIGLPITGYAIVPSVSAQATAPTTIKDDTPAPESPKAGSMIVGMGGITYRVDGNYYYMIWSDHTVVLHIPPAKAKGIIQGGPGPNQVCISGNFRSIKNVSGKNAFGADINCELYEAVAFKELQPKVSTTMMPLVAAPGIPEFTSLRAMAQRLVNYKAIFQLASGNGIRLRKATDDAQTRLRACVGHTVTWEFRVTSVRPAGIKDGGHQHGTSYPAVVTVGCGIYGIRLDQEATVGPASHQECLVIGQDISEDYAIVLRRLQIIQIPGLSQS